jgi:hypothetical protein
MGSKYRRLDYKKVKIKKLLAYSYLEQQHKAELSHSLLAVTADS